jgi:hypothetical protein
VRRTSVVCCSFSFGDDEVDETYELNSEEGTLFTRVAAFHNYWLLQQRYHYLNVIAILLPQNNQNYYISLFFVWAFSILHVSKVVFVLG